MESGFVFKLSFDRQIKVFKQQRYMYIYSVTSAETIDDQ